MVGFYCEAAAWLGGETALFDGWRAFRSLPHPLQAVLRRPVCVRRLSTLARLRRRHGIGIHALRDACRRAGARMRVLNGSDVVELSFERATIEDDVHEGCRGERGGQDGRDDARARAHHPHTAAAQRLRLHFNFGELGFAARASLLAGLLQRGCFAGWRWALHRLMWTAALRSGVASALLSFLDALPGLIRHPLHALRQYKERKAIAAAIEARGGMEAVSVVKGEGGHGHARRRQRRTSAQGVGREDGRRPTLGERVTLRQGELIGRALAAHAVVFDWQAGDVLLVDNTRVLHDGMPGIGGGRRLWVALLAGHRHKAAARAAPASGTASPGIGTG